MNRRRQLGGDRGAATLEYLGMTVLVVALVLGLALTGTGAQLANSFSAAVCQVLQIDQCPTIDAGAGDTGVPTQTPLEKATAGTYVAMGDSYASGEGSGDYQGGSDFDDRDDLWPFNDDEELHNRCHRSDNAYSQILSGIYEFEGGTTFAACSGAQVPDLTESNGSNSGENPQMDSLNKDTSLITISVGGNDLGFSDIVQACITNGESGIPGVDSCQDTYEPGMADRIADLRSTLIHRYEAMKTLAPNARIIIMGYPHLFVEDPDDNADVLMFAEDQVWMNEKGDQLNAMLREVAQEAGVEFVDPTQAFAGHGIGSKDPWINDLMFFGSGITLIDAGSFHPNTQGQSVMAALISDQIEKPK